MHTQNIAITITENAQYDFVACDILTPTELVEMFVGECGFEFSLARHIVGELLSGNLKQFPSEGASFVIRLCTEGVGPKFGIHSRIPLQPEEVAVC